MFKKALLDSDDDIPILFRSGLLMSDDLMPNENDRNS
jgi:hypothetical protein